MASYIVCWGKNADVFSGEDVADIAHEAAKSRSMASPRNVRRVGRYVWRADVQTSDGKWRPRRFTIVERE